MLESKGESMTISKQKLIKWLKECIEYEEYYIENNLSYNAPVRKVCFSQLIENIKAGDFDD